ncbi:MAG: hypothetical protein LBQ42_05405 [Synergistaceae bacterium]|jgi:hypothetical protein|nr:hypothetical protein [Synergistaceae bacterium]
MRRSRLFFSFLLFVCFLMCATLPVSDAHAAAPQGDLISVEAEGFAPIGNGGKNAAREAAKRSAQRDALEKAMGVYVEGITQVQNYEVVKDKVFSQTTGIVKDFDVIREWEDKDGVFYISALCKVSAAALDGVLGPAAIDALGNPRIMVLIDEKIGETYPFISTTEGELLKVFEKAGYQLADPSQSDALKNIDLDAARRSSDPELLREIARTFRAEVLISGKAYGSSFTRQKISGVDIYGVRSTVQLRAVLSNSAYMLGSDAIEEKTKGISEEDGAIKGFQAAAPKAGKSLVHKVAYALISGSAGGIPGRTVNVKIMDISFKDGKVLEDLLQGVDGVTAVYHRTYRNKTVEFDVVSDKTSDELAFLLSEHGVDVQDVTSATVEGQHADS